MDIIQSVSETIAKRRACSEVAIEALSDLSITKQTYFRRKDEFLNSANKQYPDPSQHYDLIKCYEYGRYKHYLNKIECCDLLATHILEFFN
jgi:hypothetical protein